MIQFSGMMRPIAYFSKGWQKGQLKRMPQVKECYAQRVAVFELMPE